MTISPEWAAVILTIIGGLAVVGGWLLRGIKEDIKDLRADFKQDSDEHKERTAMLEDRVRKHTEDENRHITAAWLAESVQWRRDLMARFERFEERVYDMLTKTK